MYIKNRSGPGTELCSTPYKIEARVGSRPWIETHCFLFDKYDLNHSFARLRIPKYSTLANKISCSTVPKVFCKSTKIPQPTFPSCRFFSNVFSETN